MTNRLKRIVVFLFLISFVGGVLGCGPHRHHSHYRRGWYGDSYYDSRGRGWWDGPHRRPYRPYWREHYWGRHYDGVPYYHRGYFR